MTAVLVTYGSRYGSTAGIADLIATALRNDGLDTDVQPARNVRRVEAYDAVVIGGALYAGRWQRDARRFVRRQAKHLRGKQVWLFSSGPLDTTAEEKDIPPVPSVAEFATALHANEHQTFGGKLTEDADSWLARRMAANGRGGDFRNPDRIAAWAHQIAAQLKEGGDDAKPQDRIRRDDP
ncbi:flavodoxin domain-containing protein [Flindersiella endophytica]